MIQNVKICWFVISNKVISKRNVENLTIVYFQSRKKKMVLQNFCSGRHKFHLRLGKRNFLKASRLREANSNISQSFASQKLAKILVAVASNFN